MGIDGKTQIAGQESTENQAIKERSMVGDNQYTITGPVQVLQTTYLDPIK